MPKRSKHNLSHYQLMTGNSGVLYPISHYEVLPGDTIQQSSSVLLRASPLLAPIMHRFHVRVHTFFVPYRLLWSGWEDFITGVDTTHIPPSSAGHGDSQNFSIVEKGSLLDHLGIPPVDTAGSGPDNDLTIWPVLAYNKIFNEYYRDQDLFPEADLRDTQLKSIAWGKDYFTSARPWPQKGPAVSMPIGGSGSVQGTATTTVTEGKVTGTGATGNSRDWLASVPYYLGSESDFNSLDAYAEGFGMRDLTLRGTTDLSGATVDLSGATAADIRDVRVAFALQRYAEARARYGSRYTEYLRYLGVRPRDARLQRPEYLGGGKRDISFSEVLQTAPGTDGVVGSMAGHGISGLRSRRFRRFFEEHGIVMTMLSVRPQSIYMDGVARSWMRQTKEDYFQKELQYVGQQEINNGELFWSGDGQNYATFGYQDRYADYGFEASKVSGDFRDILDFWHAARKFSQRPALNTQFVACNPTDRIFAVPSEDTLWVATQQQIGARRLVDRNPAPKVI